MVVNIFQKTEKKNAFISESFIGNHNDIDFFNADLISFTFLPIMNIKEPSSLNNVKIPQYFRGIWINKENKLLKEQRLSICKDLVHSHYKKIFIGMDNDYEGNAMAKLLQLELIQLGFDKENIIRVPLNVDGYTSISNFWSVEILEAYLKDRWENITYMHYSKKIAGQGGLDRRTALIISELYNPPKSVLNLNKNGNSTLTYLFKKSIGER